MTESITVWQCPLCGHVVDFYDRRKLDRRTYLPAQPVLELVASALEMVAVWEDPSVIGEDDYKGIVTRFEAALSALPVELKEEA